MLLSASFQGPLLLQFGFTFRLHKDCTNYHNKPKTRTECWGEGIWTVQIIFTWLTGRLWAEALVCRGQHSQRLSTFIRPHAPVYATAQTLPAPPLKHRPSRPWRVSPRPLWPEDPARTARWSRGMSRPALRRWRLLARPRSSAPGMASLLLLPLLLMLPLPAGANCPCQDPALCQPIHRHPDFEVRASCLPLQLWSSRPERS